jgi:hypothetical protein
MRDLIRDWNRWTPAERIAAVTLLIGILVTLFSSMAKALV